MGFGFRLLLFVVGLVGTIPSSALAVPFTYLQPGFTQELFASAPVTNSNFGGLAFAPNGDVKLKLAATKAEKASSVSSSIKRTKLLRSVGVALQVIERKANPFATKKKHAISSACSATIHDDLALVTDALDAERL